MKPLIVLVLTATWALAAEIPNVQKVYLMPMTGGLDQHLANQLAGQNVFTVVVDPKQADAIWTERIDASFFEALNEIFPPENAANDKDKSKDGGLESADKPPTRRSWGRTRGTIFLVGVASRQVLWSTFLPMEDSSPKTLHKTAEQIVKRLKM